MTRAKCRSFDCGNHSSAVIASAQDDNSKEGAEENRQRQRQKQILRFAQDDNLGGRMTNLGEGAGGRKPGRIRKPARVEFASRLFSFEMGLDYLGCGVVRR
jgi:hypothetical protein